MGSATGPAPQGRYYIALDGARGIFFLCILSLHALEVWNHLPLPSALRLPYAALQWSWMAVASPQMDIARLPSATSPLDGNGNRPAEATTHGGLDDDPALQRLVLDLIHKA